MYNNLLSHLVWLLLNIYTLNVNDSLQNYQKTFDGYLHFQECTYMQDSVSTYYGISEREYPSRRVILYVCILPELGRDTSIYSNGLTEQDIQILFVTLHEINHYRNWTLAENGMEEIKSEEEIDNRAWRDLKELLHKNNLDY